MNQTTYTIKNLIERVTKFHTYKSQTHNPFRRSRIKHSNRQLTQLQMTPMVYKETSYTTVAEYYCLGSSLSSERVFSLTRVLRWSMRAWTDISPWTLLSRVRTFTVPDVCSRSPTTLEKKSFINLPLTIHYKI